jgi:hypothetical protein
MEVASNHEDCSVEVAMLGIPAGLQFPLDMELFMPLMFHPRVVQDGRLHWRHLLLQDQFDGHGKVSIYSYEPVSSYLVVSRNWDSFFVKISDCAC